MLPQQEGFYGGAAGGGKSDALLMAALQYVDIPGYAALLLRRTFKDLALPGALMDRAHAWFGGTAAKWNDQDKTWTFPSGATVTFGYLEHEQDKYRYQGAELQFIGFDELTQFSETQYRYLFSRLRRLTTATVPLRMRSASNPGGVGHEWVKQRFVTEEDPAKRPFVRAKLADNPHLDQVEYERSLMNLDPVERARLLAGDWSIRPAGKKFQRQWFRIVEQAPAETRWLRYWDLAATEARPGKDPDWTAGALVGLHRGVWCVADMRRIRGTPAEVEALIKQTAQIDGRAIPVRMEQEPGASGVMAIDQYARRVLVGYDFHGRKASGNKELRANPVSSAAEQDNVQLLSGAWITAFLDEFEAFPSVGVHDDQVDAVSGAFEGLSQDEAVQIEVQMDMKIGYREAPWRI